MATAAEVGHWMVEHIRSNGGETQETMIRLIAERFPEWGSYVNRDGNPVIDPKVLRQFRKLHGGSIEWDKAERMWSSQR